MADFKFYLNRQGPKGEPGTKGEKGDNGNTPTFSDGINTPTVYTMQIDMGDGNVFETQNLKYPMRDDGGNYLRYDRTDSTVTLSAPNIANLQRTSGEVTLASVSDVENENAQDTDAVSMELRNADQLALNNEINRIDGSIDAVDNKVDREIQDRRDADTQLTNKINTDVGNEATTRGNADIALSGRIDGLDSSKANKSDVYTKTQTDTLLNGKANTVHTHNLSQITDAGSLAGKNTVDYGTEVTNKPTIGNGTITITQGGITKGTFTTNQSGNSTIALDAGGGGGGTIYSPGDAIDLTNDAISVKYDNSTLKLNSSGQLYADIPAAPTVDQTYNAASTNAQSGVAIAGAGFMNGSIVQNPLEYQEDTTSNIMLHNINSTTLTDTRNNGYYTVDIVGGSYCHQLFLRDSVNNTYINLMEDSTAINLDNLSYVEIRLHNGVNIEYSISSNNIVGVLGYYNNGTFIPKFVRGAINASDNVLVKVENTALNFWKNDTLGTIYGMYKNTNNTNLVLNGLNNTGTSGSINSFTLSQQESDDLDACTHCRLIAVQGGPRVAGNSTINLNNIKFINPVTSVTSGTTSDQYNTFINSNNLLDAHPASLSLKYDSTTLGVNANNELTVPTATTSSKGLVQPDGTTITINNGVISAGGSTPSNMVTTNTSQTITGIKTFDADCFKTKNVLFNESGYSYGLRINSGTLRYGQTSGDYSYMETSSIGVEASSYKHQLAANGLWSGTGTNNAYTQRIGLSGSGYSYLSNNQGRKFYNPAYSSATSSFTPNANTPFFMTSDLLDGTTITYNSSTGKISATGGSTPSNMVTTDTTQTITASKAFHPTDSLTYCQIGGYYGTHYGGYISAKRYDSNYPERSTMFTVDLDNDKGGSINFSDNNLNSIGGLFTSYNNLTLKSRTGTYYVQKNNSNSLIIDQTMLDGTTISYNNTTGKISAAANPPIATSSSTGVVQPDNSTITVDGSGVISAVNNSIAKTAPIIPLKYEEQEDGISVGIGGTLNHTNYTSSVDQVYVYDVTVPNINNQSGDGYFTQSAANMMSKIFYKGYIIRLDNGLNIAWNIAESSGFFMNVAIGYYDNGTFIPVLYALNDSSYGGQMFARPAMEFGSDIYSMGRLTTQFEECVGISLVGDVLNGFSSRSGRHPYTISDTTLLAEMRKCTHAICTVVNESSTETSFNYSTGKFVNPETSLITNSEASRNAIFSAAENLILNTDTTVVPELKLNYDSTYFKVVNNQLTLDIQAIKNAIDALSNSSGNASQSGNLEDGGWL